MNSLDSQLNRLLRSAGSVPSPSAVQELPFPAQARVLAAWRQARSETTPWLFHWLRAGLATAALTAALAWGVSWSSTRPTAGDEYSVANAALYVAVTP